MDSGLNDLAKAYFLLGRVEGAWEAGREARELWNELGNMPMLADNLHTASFGYLFMGDLDKALARAQECVRVSESSSNLWGQAAGLALIGYAHLEIGDAGAAIKAFQDCFQLAEQADFKGMGTERALLGWSYGILGDIEHGLELVHLSLAGAENVLEERLVALAVLAMLQLLNGNLDEASAAIKRAYDAIDNQEPDLTFTYGFVHLAAAEVALASREFDRVMKLTDQGISAMEERNIRLVLPDVMRVRGQALLGQGRTAEARQALAEARTTAETTGSRRALWPILTALAQLESEDGNVAEAEALRTQAREVIGFIADHAGTPELGASFLSMPQVRALMESSATA